MSSDMLVKAVQMLVTVPAEMRGTLVDLLEKVQGEDGKKCFAGLKKYLRGELVEKPIVYLRQLFTEQTITVGSTTVFVYEMVVDGTYSQIFGSLGPNRRCWKDRAEVDEFCRLHHDKLRSGGYATFFEMEGSVLHAHVRDGRLGVYASRFDDVYVWRAGGRLRVVVPQL